MEQVIATEMKPNPSSRRLFAVRSFVCVVVAMGCLCHPASDAATFVVSNTTDSTNVASLRGAIIRANAVGGTNKIVLSTGSYPLSISGPDEAGGYTGDLNITKGSLTIVGVSAAATSVNATGLGDRVFQVSSNAQLILVNLTIQSGTAPWLPSNAYGVKGEPGGAIFNAGALTVQGCAVIGNACVYSGCGGGIYNGGTANLDHCVISNNVAGTGPDSGEIGNPGGGGGGIYNVGIMVLTNCAISCNQAGQGGASGYSFFGASGGGGGGIWNSGTLNLFFCTVNHNEAGGGGSGGSYFIGGAGGVGGSGAGIYNEGTLALNSCTLCENQAGPGGSGGNGVLDDSSSIGGTGGNGGGICNNDQLSLIACTIVKNETGVGGDGGGFVDYGYEPVPGGGGHGGDGGGVWNTSTNPAAIWNTIIAMNSAQNGGVGGSNYDGMVGSPGTPGAGNDGNGLFSSQGFNLIGRIGGFTDFTKAKGDVWGNDAKPVDPNLSPLQMNGGSVPTVALLAGSPAIDAGDDAILGTPEFLTQDQRGSPRLSGAHVDIGAVEYDGKLNGVVLPPLLANEKAGRGLQFWFNGATGLKYSVWTSSNLVTWTSNGLASEASRGWFSYTNALSGNSGHRYYRVRYP